VYPLLSSSAELFGFPRKDTPFLFARKTNLHTIVYTTFHLSIIDIGIFLIMINL